MKATEVQVGGNHYKQFKIQPIEFCMKNGLNACQTNIVKYICRYKHKNGKEDLLKALHYVELWEQFIKGGMPNVKSELFMPVYAFYEANLLSDEQHTIIHYVCFCHIEEAKRDIKKLIKTEYPDAD